MPSGKRLLVVTTAFPRWEKDVITPWLLKELTLIKSKGYDITVFTSSYKALKQKEFQGLKLYRFRYAPKGWEKLTHDTAVPVLIREKPLFKLLVLPYLISGFLHAFALSLSRKFDIVYVQWPVPHLLFALPFKILKKSKIILYFHGSDVALLRRLPRPIQMAFNFLIAKSDKILTNSNYLKGLIEGLGIRKGIEVVPLGNPHSDNLEPYKEKKEINILFVGRLIDWKGVDVLLKAFQKVKEKYKDAQLNIVGDGILKDTLIKLSQDLKLQNVHFKGFLTGEPLIQEFRNATIFVLPSIMNEMGETEGLGMVLVEALSYGIPLVGSNIGGIPDIIIDKETGLLANPGDADDLAQKIITFIEDPNLRRETVEKGQKWVVEKFSWEAIVDKLDKIFKN